ncbi:MAG: Kelch repeat-containing protein [Candidatus Bathyarchaeia archaeon]
MRKKLVLAAALMLALLAPTSGVLVRSSDPIVGVANLEHFPVEKTFGGFAGTVCFAAFNASRGDWIDLNISSFGDYGYEVILTVAGAQHGEVFNATDTGFTQTVNLEQEDTYNVTLAKRPFYSTVTVNGEINVHHQQTSNLTHDFWTEKAPMSTPRHRAGVAVVNGIIYVMGGRRTQIDGNHYTTVATNSTEAYDPATDTWTKKADMPTPMDGFGAAAFQGIIYAIGGSVNYAYDPSKNTWTTKTSMPTHRNNLQANVAGGRIYLIGGTTADNEVVNVNEFYDPATDSWATAAPMPVAVEDYASAVVDGRIYVVSGRIGVTQNLNDSIVSLTQIYDPATDAWTTGAPIPMGVSAASAGATIGAKAPKAIYVVGGANADHPLNGQVANQVYFPENDSWSAAASMPKDRAGLSVAVADDVLYAVGGGHNIFTPDTTDVRQYTPIDYGAAAFTSSAANTAAPSTAPPEISQPTEPPSTSPPISQVPTANPSQPQAPIQAIPLAIILAASVAIAAATTVLLILRRHNR